MTAISAIKNQSISAQDLAELLSAEGLAYEALGAGVSEAMECLAHAREFYALPAWLEPGLGRFAGHLEQALQELSELQSAANTQQ